MRADLVVGVGCNWGTAIDLIGIGGRIEFSVGQPTMLTSPDLGGSRLAVIVIAVSVHNKRGAEAVQMAAVLGIVDVVFEEHLQNQKCIRISA